MIGRENRDFEEPSDREGVGKGIGQQGQARIKAEILLCWRVERITTFRYFYEANICDFGAILSEGKGLTPCWIPGRGHIVIYPSQEKSRGYS